MFGQNNCVICFQVGDDFISNSTLQLLYYDDMVNV